MLLYNESTIICIDILICIIYMHIFVYLYTHTEIEQCNSAAYPRHPLSVSWTSPGCDALLLARMPHAS